MLCDDGFRAVYCYCAQFGGMRVPFFGKRMVGQFDVNDSSGCQGRGRRFNSVSAPTLPVRAALVQPSVRFKLALRRFARPQLAAVRCNSAHDSPSDNLPWDGGYPPSQFLLRRAPCGTIWSWNEGLRSSSSVQPEHGRLGCSAVERRCRRTGSNSSAQSASTPE